MARLPWSKLVWLGAWFSNLGHKNGWLISLLATLIFKQGSWFRTLAIKDLIWSHSLIMGFEMWFIQQCVQVCLSIKKKKKKSKQIKTPLNTHFLCIYQVFKPKITIRGTKCFIYKTPSLKLELYFLPPTLHKYLYLQSNHHTKGVRWFEKHFHITDCFYYFIIILIFCLFCFVLFFVCLFVCLVFSLNPYANWGVILKNPDHSLFFGSESSSFLKTYLLPLACTNKWAKSFLHTKDTMNSII